MIRLRPGHLLCMQAAHWVQAAPPSIEGLRGGSLTHSSFLGPLLPESLLYVLTTQGPGAFAAAMTAESDTPEVVWTHHMRTQRLVPQVRGYALPALASSMPAASSAACPGCNQPLPQPCLAWWR